MSFDGLSGSYSKMADSAGVRQPILILLLGLGAVISSSPCLAQEAETFSIGGGGRSWQDVGTAPGGVIDFVDRLGGVTDLAGESVFVGAPDSLRGWIAPLRLRPDVNISLGVLDRGGRCRSNSLQRPVPPVALDDGREGRVLHGWQRTPPSPRPSRPAPALFSEQIPLFAERR